MNRHLKRYLTITAGTCVSGIAMNAFFLPNHLLSGGITGLGMILYYLFGWTVDVTNIVFNIPLFILAYKLMSREYFISGIYGTFALSFWIRVFSFLNGAVPVTDPMLCSMLPVSFTASVLAPSTALAAARGERISLAASCRSSIPSASVQRDLSSISYFYPLVPIALDWHRPCTPLWPILAWPR